MHHGAFLPKFSTSYQLCGVSNRYKVPILAYRWNIYYNFEFVKELEMERRNRLILGSFLLLAVNCSVSPKVGRLVIRSNDENEESVIIKDRCQCDPNTEMKFSVRKTMVLILVALIISNVFRYRQVCYQK